MEPRRKRNAGIPKRYQGEMVLDDATFKSLIISQKSCSVPKSQVELNGKKGYIKKEYPLARVSNGPTQDEAVIAPNIECIALGPTQFEIRFAEVPVPPKQSLPNWPKELPNVSQVLPCYVRLDRNEVTRYLLKQEEKKVIVLNSSKKRQISCQRCCRTFTSRIHLKKHKCKRSAAPALCHFCDTSFSKTEDLIQHLLSCASFITPVPSPVNGESANDAESPSEFSPPALEVPPTCEFCLKTFEPATEKFVHYDVCIPYHETRLIELWPRIQPQKCQQKSRKLVKTKYKRRKVKVPSQQNAEEIDDEACVRVHQHSPLKAKNPKNTEDFYQSELRKAVESIASLEDSEPEEILPTYVLPGKRYLEITVTDVDYQSEESSGQVKNSSFSLADISDPDVVVVECPLNETSELTAHKLESPTSTTADIPPTSVSGKRIVNVAIKKCPKRRKHCVLSPANSDTMDAPESANLPHLSLEVLQLCNRCCQHKHECTCTSVIKEKFVNLTLVRTKENNKKIVSGKKKVSVLDLIKAPS